MNDYFWQLAQRSAKISGIKAEWIFCQWSHETADFTSELCLEYHNLGGLTQTEPTDAPQPDGSLWYMKFVSYEDYAEYFGRYLKLYESDGIYEATTIPEYAEALKRGGYFGDSVENYINGMMRVYTEEFDNIP